jgi:hypothetical protein
VRLTPDGRWVALAQPLLPITGGLDIIPGPGGALVLLDQFNMQLEVLAPVDGAATGAAEALDIFPWRAPATGGVPFVIGGRNLGTLADTSVSIDGLPATVTSVSGTRIRGVLPAQPAPTVALLDVTVTSGGTTTTLPAAFRYLFTPAGHEPGVWTPTGISSEAQLPAPLADLAAAVIEGELLVLAPSSPATHVLDLLALGKPLGGAHWHTHAARPFVGADHSVEVLAGKLHVVGGLGGGSEGRLQLYDPDSDTWSNGPSLPWPGGAVSTGGHRRQALLPRAAWSGPAASTSAAVYDPAAGAWTPLAPMPAGRQPRRRRHGRQPASTSWAAAPARDTLSAGTDDVQVFDPAHGRLGLGQAAGLDAARRAGRARRHRAGDLVAGRALRLRRLDHRHGARPRRRLRPGRRHLAYRGTDAHAAPRLVAGALRRSHRPARRAHDDGHLPQHGLRGVQPAVSSRHRAGRRNLRA